MNVIAGIVGTDDDLATTASGGIVVDDAYDGCSCGYDFAFHSRSFSCSGGSSSSPRCRSRMVRAGSPVRSDDERRRPSSLWPVPFVLEIVLSFAG